MEVGYLMVDRYLMVDAPPPHARSDTLPGFLGLRAYSAISETITEK